jgi:ABC-type sugar transport system permease subunit
MKLTAKSSVKSAKNKSKLFIIGMLAFPIVHFLIFFVYINISTITLCFQRLNYATGKVEFVGFANFIDFFGRLHTDRVLPMAITNSILFIPITNFVLLPISFIFAYILYKKLPFYKLFRTLFFLPSIISIVILTMVFSFMFDSTFGVFNDFLKFLHLGSLQHVWFGDPKTAMPMVYIYCIWAGVGMNIVLLSGAITRIPFEIIEYGKLEGIGMIRELFQVIFPMIWPTISTVFILGTTSAFVIFLQPQLLTNGGPNGASYTIALYIVQQTLNGSIYFAATVGIFVSLIGVTLIMTVKAILDRIGQVVEY